MNNRKIFSVTLRQTLTAALFLMLPLLTVQAQTQVSVVATVTTGGQPTGLGVDPSSNLIYVANKSGNAVNVIDGTTDTVLTTIPVGSQPVAIAVSRTPRRVFVANTGDASISVIDSDTASPTFNTVINTISLTTVVDVSSTALANLRGIAVASAPASMTPPLVFVTRVYVPVPKAGSSAARLLVIDPANNSIVPVNLQSNAENPVVAAFQPSANRIIVGYSSGRQRLSYIATANNALSNGPDLNAPNHNAIGVNLWFNKIYVHHRGTNNNANTPQRVANIDGAGTAQTIIGTTTVGTGTGDIGVAYGRNYVANGNNGTVSVVDTYCSAPDPNGGGDPVEPCPNPNPNPNPNQYKVIQTVTVGTTPWGVAVNGSSGKIYVANSGSGTVSVLAKQQN